MICEKCWHDAIELSKEKGGSVYDNYINLINERQESPCSYKDRAGRFFDEKRGVDIREEKGLDPVAAYAFRGEI